MSHSDPFEKICDKKNQSYREINNKKKLGHVNNQLVVRSTQGEKDFQQTEGKPKIEKYTRFQYLPPDVRESGQNFEGNHFGVNGTKPTLNY